MNIRRGITRHALRLAQRIMRTKGVKSEEGTSLVELAISLPVMLTLLTGAASFSLAFYTLQQLGNATSTAVQLTAANQGLVSDPCETAAAAVESALPNWTTTKLTFTLAWTDASGGSHSCGSNRGSVVNRVYLRDGGRWLLRHCDCDRSEHAGGSYGQL